MGFNVVVVVLFGSHLQDYATGHHEVFLGGIVFNVFGQVAS